MVPAKFFLTRGDGRYIDRSTSLGFALRDAKIFPYSRVMLSPIIPPHCKEISVEEGLKELKEGEVIYCAFSEISSDEPHRLMAASIGVADTKDSSQYGYIVGYTEFGRNYEFAGSYVEYLAAYMLDSILKTPQLDSLLKSPQKNGQLTEEEKLEGIKIMKELEENKILPEDFTKERWKVLENKYKTEGKISKTKNIAQSATVGADGLWTTVIAAAVFIPADPHQFLTEQIGYLKLENELNKNKIDSLEGRVKGIEEYLGMKAFKT